MKKIKKSLNLSQSSCEKLVLLSKNLLIPQTLIIENLIEKTYDRVKETNLLENNRDIIDVLSGT